MSTFLITGGAGFIGSHLADYLLRKGEKVIIIDNLSTGKKENIVHLAENPNLQFFEGDITNEELVGKLIKDCDIIYHLAAAVGVRLVIEKPLDSLKTNVEGTEIILKLASKHNKKTLIASSSEVYGKNYDIPLKETDDRILGNTHITRWNYSCAKALDEFLALAYHKEKKLSTIIARFFNVVGPKQAAMYGMVVPNFIKQALNNETINVHGDGKQIRTFCFVEDVVEILYELTKNENAIGQVINIGSKEEISILELAEKIKSMANSKSEITFVPYEKVFNENFEDSRRRAPSITKLKELTGLEPKTNLDGILKVIIDHFKSSS
ncbi:MAG: GDP-mannose 4,6-dehydratase [Nanoarchaeota archaeon]|nr:GDP-mannose 4,6-dehydratase [Nanoarchaeota archaeon]